MHRIGLTAVVLLASTSLLTAQRVFRAGVDLVHVGVVVTDRSGSPILGLTADDFEILEDGEPQTVQALRRRRPGGGAAAAPRLHDRQQRQHGPGHP